MLTFAPSGSTLLSLHPPGFKRNGRCRSSFRRTSFQGLARLPSKPHEFLCTMLSFFRKIARRRSPRQPPEMVPCPHCGADVPATAAACRHCGYDWEPGPDEGVEEGYADDEFDYESYIEEEFGNEEWGQRHTRLSLPSWQRVVVVVLVIAFVLWLLGPALF